MRYFYSMIIVVILFACENYNKQDHLNHNAINKIIASDFELYKAQYDQQALLILFPSIGGNSNTIQENFDILYQMRKEFLFY